MNRSTRVLIAAALIAAALPSIPAQGFLDGRWEGSIDLGEGPEPLVLRLFGADPEAGLAEGGLLDLPARTLFGCPMDTLARDAEGISFSLLGGAPFSGLFELKGSAPPTDPGGSAAEGLAVSGAARLLPEGGEKAGELPAEASFIIAYSGADSRGAGYGADCRVDTGKGLLPGSLLLPEGAEGELPPIVLILSGAAADRDGDNYSVPGRSDALAELAIALRGRGVASLRFDKRGTGEAYRFAAKEEDLRFDDHVADARAAISQLAADPRFSRVAVIGYGEGALVGAAALAGDAPARASGIAALCASGRTELEMLEASLASAPEELKPEAEAIISALRGGGSYPDPSPYFADYFKPSAQPYLASLFRFDIRSAFAAALPSSPALVIAGASDLQVPPAEAELLSAARPDAAYRVIPGMGHTLKEVGGDEEANYSSFTDPSLPVAQALVDLLSAFVKGEALPDLNAVPQGDEGAGEGLPR